LTKTASRQNFSENIAKSFRVNNYTVKMSSFLVLFGDSMTLLELPLKARSHDPYV